MAKVVRQPKSTKESVAARRIRVTLMPMLCALLALYSMATAAAKTSNRTTEGGPSAAINGRETEYDSDKFMGPCLTAFEPQYRTRGIKRRPDAFFLGPSKCGTTSIANWMAHHPATRWFSNRQMGFPSRPNNGEEAKNDTSNDTIFKEDMVVGPDDTYALTALPNNASTCLIDYAAHYLTMTKLPYSVLKRLGAAATDGSIKYIVSLREPAMRTISSWEFKYTWKSENENFDKDKAGIGAGFRRLTDVVNEGIEGANRLLECMGDEYQLSTADREEQCILDFERSLMSAAVQTRHPPREWGLGRHAFRDVLRASSSSCPPESYLGPKGDLYLAHVGKGMYALQLKRWFKLLGQDNFKVVFFEETVAHPLATMQSIFDFLGLDLMDRNGQQYPEALEYWERVVRVVHNETSDKKKTVLGQEVTQEIIQTLRDFFAPHNTELEHLLGRPLPDSWSRSSE